MEMVSPSFDSVYSSALVMAASSGVRVVGGAVGFGDRRLLVVEVGHVDVEEVADIPIGLRLLVLRAVHGDRAAIDALQLQGDGVVGHALLLQRLGSSMQALSRVQSTSRTRSTASPTSARINLRRSS